MAFSLVRNTKVYVSTVAFDTDVATTLASMSDLNTWQIPVLDGYAFSADTETEEITISEAGAAPKRGQQVFTTSVQPVNWSLSCYLRPRYEASPTSKADSVDRLLWEAMASKPWESGDPGSDITTNADGNATTRNATSMDVTFASSDTNQLRTLTLIFFMEGTAWMVTDVVVNQLEVDFSIDTIAMATWSGFGNSIKEISGASLTTLQGWTGSAITDTRNGTNDYLAAPTDNACIRNKLTTVTLQDNISPGTTYQLAITGGSLTINNNVEYLVPESLGVVNQPCAHFTGARQISGELTAYLKSGTTATAGLLSDLLADTTTVTQDFDLDIYVGGASTATPIIQFSMPHAHLNIPTINVESVLGVTIGFAGLPYNTSGGVFDLEQTNELTVSYKPEI